MHPDGSLKLFFIGGEKTVMQLNGGNLPVVWPSKEMRKKSQRSFSGKKLKSQ